MKAKATRPDLMKVEEVADRLGKNHNTIREGLISGKLDFGVAIKMDKDYSYIIPRRRFEMWVSGESMRPITRSANIKRFKIKHSGNKAANPS